MVRDIVHLNINVTDIQRSIAFYRKLGFEVIHVFGNDIEGLDPHSKLNDGMDVGDDHVRGAVLSLGTHPRAATKIELLEWVRPPTAPQPPRSLHQAGVSRIALRVENLLELCEKLRAQGIEFEGEPREIDIVGAKRFVLFRDPDGTLLELIEF